MAVKTMTRSERVGVRRRRSGGRFLQQAVGPRAILVVVCLLYILPFYWMALVSLSAGADQITVGNPWILNHPPYLGNFADLLQSPRFGRWMANTLLVTGGTVLVALGASLAAAYAISQMGRRSARALLTLLLATYAFPQTVLALPLLVMMSPATDAEITVMQGRLARALDAGAAGFSTGLYYPTGRPAPAGVPPGGEEREMDVAPLSSPIASSVFADRL